MITGLEQPTPHKSLPPARALPQANYASSIANTHTRAILRSHSLPTPSLSPCPSQSSASASASSSSVFSSPSANMIALSNPTDSFAPFASYSLSPFGSASNCAQPKLHARRQFMPATPDASCLALPLFESEQFESFRASKSRVVRLSGIPASPDASARALAEVFPLFTFSQSHPHSLVGDGFADIINCPSLTPTPLRMWTLRHQNAMELQQGDGERLVWAVFASHEEACAALTLSGYGSGSGNCSYAYDEDSGLGCSDSVHVMPALESELEPFSKLTPFSPKVFAVPDPDMTIQNRSTQTFLPSSSSFMEMQRLMRLPPPSPTSSNTNSNMTDAETEAELFFPDAPDDAHRRLSYAGANSFGIGYRNRYGYGSASASSNIRALMPASSRQQLLTNSALPAVSSSPSMEALQMMRAYGFTLSTNPPKARTGFRHGDWICAVPTCSAHNFGRNVACIQCSAPRASAHANLDFLGSSGHAQPQPYAGSNGLSNIQNPPFTPVSTRNMSPRFANPLNLQQHQVNQQRQQQELLVKAHMQVQAQAQAQAQAHPLLTPSGRAFAVGGKVQNISTDPLAPCIMFWPDNEPFPEPGQIRPSTLANISHPPIMNTGNKGPIERQPGDWVCRKCDYLNWRRRKVCQTCFPYAEGNGDSVSATMHAERLALLAAVYGQAHPQVTNAYASASLQFPAQAQNFNNNVNSINNSFQLPVPTASAHFASASGASNLPLISGHSSAIKSQRSQHQQASSANMPPIRSSIPSLTVSTSVMNPNSNTSIRGAAGGLSHRMQSAAGGPLRSGNIVYETPPSPSVVRPPPSLSSALACGGGGGVSPQTASPLHAGPYLPSFLKQEVQASPRAAPPRLMTSAISSSCNGTRSPASLSPASSSSADFPLDEHNSLAKSVGVIGSGRNAAFYAHPRGAGSGSSMGSSSSLTLAGGSIWSLERDENKAWNGDLSAAADALKGLVL